MAILEKDWQEFTSTTPGLADDWNIYGAEGLYSVETKTPGDNNRSEFRERYQKVYFDGAWVPPDEEGTRHSGIRSNDLKIIHMQSTADIEFSYRSNKPLYVGRWTGSGLIGLDGGSIPEALSPTGSYDSIKVTNLQVVGNGEPFRGLVFYIEDPAISDWFELDRISCRRRLIVNEVDPDTFLSGTE